MSMESYNNNTYDGGESVKKFSERELLGDDQPVKDRNLEDRTVQSEGNGNVVVIKAENGETDLYDAAIEPSVPIKSESSTNSNVTFSASIAQSHPPQSKQTDASTGVRRYHCYVGNMTWWTTDVELEAAVFSCGVSGSIDVKFHENRANGQSKGFALVGFQTEAALKTINQKLVQRKVNGQQLVVLPYTKASLQKLEEATKPHVPEKEPKKEEPKAFFMGTFRIGVQPQLSQPSQAPLMSQNIQPRPQVQVPSVPPVPVMQSSAASSFMISQMRCATAAPQTMHLPSISIRPPVIPNGPPPVVSQLQIPGAPQMNRPPPSFMPVPHGIPPSTALSVPQNVSGASGPVHVVPNYPHPGAHINPHVYVPGLRGDHGDGMTEVEFEEIMNRNRTLSSSAITRAVSDVAANDAASAMETLVTAISLIRQSRVAHDDRCKVLIASLQDTLSGIESKIAASRKHRSNRDRSRTPGERSRKRHRRSRSRSHSHDRYDIYRTRDAY